MNMKKDTKMLSDEGAGHLVKQYKSIDLIGSSSNSAATSSGFFDDFNMISAVQGHKAITAPGQSSSETQVKGGGKKGNIKDNASLSEFPHIEKALKNVRDVVTAGCKARANTLRSFNLMMEKMAKVKTLCQQTEADMMDDAGPDAQETDALQQIILIYERTSCYMHR